ncbi:LysR family transcriptional regulator, partial [Bradyrhizobium sp. UFLA05-109]
MRLKPRQVEAFRTVMMTGGITAAADAMNVTQPAVSRLIRDLEEIVEITLFERVASRLVPTAEGTRLFREVERLYLGLDQIAQAAEDIRRHKNTV